MLTSLSNLRSILLIFILFLLLIFFLNFRSVSSPFMKGMTISCQTWGSEWATPQMKEAMLELKNEFSQVLGWLEQRMSEEPV